MATELETVSGDDASDDELGVFIKHHDLIVVAIQNRGNDADGVDITVKNSDGKVIPKTAYLSRANFTKRNPSVGNLIPVSAYMHPRYGVQLRVQDAPVTEEDIHDLFK